VPVRIHNVPLWLGEPEGLLRQRAAQALGVPPAALQSVRTVRTTLDARKKGSPRYVHTVEVTFVEGAAPRTLPPGVTELEPPPPPPARVRPPEQRPVIVGTGPAGLFCALGLLERGVPSVLLERGREVVPRRDVARLMRDGTLDPEQHELRRGRRGAHRREAQHPHQPPPVRKVPDLRPLRAPEQIPVDGKPHIGSDLLLRSGPPARGAARRGCEVPRRPVEDVRQHGRTTGVALRRTPSRRTVVLAPGNSARELERFAADGRAMEAKLFTTGFGPTSAGLIDAIQYGSAACIGAAPPTKAGGEPDAGESLRVTLPHAGASWSPPPPRTGCSAPTG
jgi:uncharacterized FAD-dependent dehydrogenase